MARYVDPNMQIMGMYVDQIGKEDMSRDVSRQFNIPIYPSIAEALTPGGGKLAVDAVLLIGEHGNYPTNAKAQVQYPRKEFFDQIVAVFRSSGRVAPVFNDKHLSYRWDWAKEMVDTAREMKIPLMAGSSVPLAERRPPLELPRARRSSRPCRSTAAGSKATTSMRWKCCSRWSKPAPAAKPGVRDVAVPRRRRAVESGRARAAGRATWPPRRWRPNWAPTTRWSKFISARRPGPRRRRQCRSTPSSCTIATACAAWR